MFAKLKSFGKKLGPGLITGAGDDDPSGIATYSQAGAGFGLRLLWMAFITYPLMFGVQEMCGRIGFASGKSITTIVKESYSKSCAYLMICLMLPAVIFNIAADLSGMGAVANLLFPVIPTHIYSLTFCLLIAAGVIFFQYKKMSRVLIWLSLSLVLYMIIPFLIYLKWNEVLYSFFIPHFEWNKEFIEIFVAILGTTISPYLFFWQTSMSIEEKNHTFDKTSKKEIKDMKIDSHAGMLLSNIIMFFIILTTGAVLFPAGITKIETVKEAAEALKPLAGEFAYLLFAVGIIGTGLLAIPILGGCLGYMFADIFQWKKGMDKKFREAPRFYAIILASIFLGYILNLCHLNPIKALIYSAILYGLLAPFLIAVILHICNSKKIMGEFTNRTDSNILGFAALILMSFGALSYLMI